MTDAAEPDASEPPKRAGSRLPLLIGLVLALAGAGAGFLVVRMGLIGGSDASGAAGHGDVAEDLATLPELAPVAYVPLDPLMVNLPPGSGREYLRFTAQIETDPEHLHEVETLRPRIVDVLNGFLRAVDLTDLEDPAALTRLRAQMLRRVQVVTGEGRVRDLLVMEFVLN